MFFAEENNSKVLGAFIRKAEAAHIEDKSRAKRLSTAKEIIALIPGTPYLIIPIPSNFGDTILNCLLTVGLIFKATSHRHLASRGLNSIRQLRSCPRNCIKRFSNCSDN